MAHRGQTYRVYDQFTVVVKRLGIHSGIALPERTTLASRARNKRELEGSNFRNRMFGLLNPLFKIGLPHSSRRRRTGRRCPENGDSLGSRSRSPPSAPRSCRQASFHDTPRQPFAPDIQQPRAALYGMIFLTSRCGEKAIDRHTYGVKDSRVSLLQFDSQVILPVKNHCSLIQS